MKKWLREKYNNFIVWAKKYRDEVNKAILYIVLAASVYYLIVNFNDIINWIIQFPHDMWDVMKKLYNLGYAFLVKFISDMMTWPNNIKIISIGVIKRFIIEDLIIPVLVINYWKIIKIETIVYFRLKYREIKKLPVLLFGPIFAPFAGLFAYFKVLGVIGFWGKKIFANKIFSKIKILFITWIPAMWVFLMDLPFISLIIEYTFLSKIVSYFKDLEIPFITKAFSNLLKKIDNLVKSTQSFFNEKIGLWLRKKAISKKEKTIKKINEILKNNSDDYHVSGKGYDFKSFNFKLDRLKNWKVIRKDKKKKDKKIKRKIKIQKIKKMPEKLKKKIQDFKKKGEKN